ncbi:MAG: hypothetical protein WCS17_10445 [Prevotella sp.]
MDNFAYICADKTIFNVVLKWASLKRYIIEAHISASNGIALELSVRHAGK